MAALAAMQDMAKIEAGKANLPNFDETLSARLESVAFTAYVYAAGHYQDDARSHIPESSPEATARGQKALDDWNRLIKTKPSNLASLALYGEELHDPPPPMTTMDYIKGIGSLIGLAVLAVVAYYVWRHRP